MQTEDRAGHGVVMTATVEPLPPSDPQTEDPIWIAPWVASHIVQPVEYGQWPRDFGTELPTSALPVTDDFEWPAAPKF